MTRARVRALIDRGLEGVPVLRGRWEWAYGPAVYRSPVGLRDDALLYAVQDRQDPRRLVIALRGTNPVSIIDWLFGDFLVGMQVAWPYHPAASISLSTALGLSVVRRMRVEPRTGWLSEKIGEAIAAAEAEVVHAARALSERVESSPGTARLRALYRHLAVARHQPDEDPISALHRGWASELRHELFEHLAAGICGLEDHCSPGLLMLIDDAAAIDDLSATGIDLRSFLAGFVERARGEPVSIVVTGHSKGATQAQVVALWLAETQGPGAAEVDAWDPAAWRRSGASPTGVPPRAIPASPPAPLPSWGRTSTASSTASTSCPGPGPPPISPTSTASTAPPSIPCRAWRS